MPPPPHLTLMNNKWSFPPPAFDVLIRQCRAYPQGTEFTPKTPRSRKKSFCGEDNLHTPMATECYLYPIGTNPKCCGGRNRTSVKGLMRPLGEPTHSPLFQRTKILAGVEESNLFYGPQPRMRFIPQREIPTTLLCCKSNLAIRLHFKELGR